MVYLRRRRVGFSQKTRNRGFLRVSETVLLEVVNTDVTLFIYLYYIRDLWKASKGTFSNQVLNLMINEIFVFFPRVETYFLLEITVSFIATKLHKTLSSHFKRITCSPTDWQQRRTDIPDRNCCPIVAPKPYQFHRCDEFMH